MLFRDMITIQYSRLTCIGTKQKFNLSYSEMKNIFGTQFIMHVIIIARPHDLSTIPSGINSVHKPSAAEVVALNYLPGKDAEWEKLQ